MFQSRTSTSGEPRWLTGYNESDCCDLHEKSLTLPVNVIAIPIIQVWVWNWSVRIGSRTDKDFMNPTYKNSIKQQASNIIHARPQSTLSQANSILRVNSNKLALQWKCPRRDTIKENTNVQMTD